MRIITPIVLVALWAALAQASDSSSLKIKLQNRKESEISMEKRVRNISEEARLSILANREKERVHQEEAFSGRLEGMRDDRNYKNREDAFRPSDFPRYSEPESPM